MSNSMHSPSKRRSDDRKIPTQPLQTVLATMRFIVTGIFWGTVELVAWIAYPAVKAWTIGGGVLGVIATAPTVWVLWQGLIVIDGLVAINFAAGVSGVMIACSIVAVSGTLCVVKEQEFEYVKRAYMPSFLKQILNQDSGSSGADQSEDANTEDTDSTNEGAKKSGVGVEANRPKRTADDDRGQKGIDANEVNLDGSDPSDSSSGETDAISSDFISTPPDIDFDDVAGMESLKQKLQTRVIDPIENPEEYEKYGLTVENGFLFHGPPGTGKTYISKALAGELGINYAEVKGSDLISRFVGAGTENVAKLFEEARNNQPCMIFIDEIDAVAPERSGSGQHQMQTQMVNQLLEEIGAINDSDADIVVVGATNKPEEVDEAIKRSGRLTAEIEIGNPDADSRIAILDTHLDAPRTESLELVHFGRKTDGLSAADMEQVAISAARNAMQRGGKVSEEDIKSGINEVR